MSCGFQAEGDGAQHDCPTPIHIIFKNRTFLQRCKDWLFDNLTLITSFVSIAIINSIFLLHCDWPSWHKIIESGCLGIALPRILRYE